MEQLDEKANRFGASIQEVRSLAQSLLPVLKGNTDQLDQWVERALLLRNVNPPFYLIGLEG